MTRVGLRVGQPQRRGPVVREHVHTVGEHVHRLRVRDVGDEGERHQGVEPPEDRVAVVRGRLREPEAVPALGECPGHRGPLLVVREPGPPDPDALLEQAGAQDGQQAAREQPVAEHELLAAVPVLRLLRAGVVQPERFEHAAADHQVAQADHGEEGEDVQDDGIDLVEPAVEEAPALSVARDDVPGDPQDVVVDGERHRSGEEHQEAPEHTQVGQAHGAGAAADRGIGGDHPDRVPVFPLADARGGTQQRVLDRRPPAGRAAPAVLRDSAPHAVAEQRDGQGREDVEDDLTRGPDLPEDRPGHRVRVEVAARPDQPCRRAVRHALSPPASRRSPAPGRTGPRSSRSGRRRRSARPRRCCRR